MKVTLAVAALAIAAAAVPAGAHPHGRHAADVMGQHNCMADVITGQRMGALRKRAEARVWSYSANTGPAFWGSLKDTYKQCSLGSKQSPIDFGNNGDIVVTETGSTPFVFQWPAKLDAPEFENLGYTLEVVPDTSASGGVLYNGKFFALQQFHYHFASEHRFNGHAHPAEVHFVHKAADGELLVVGALLELVDNSNGANNGAGWQDFLIANTPQIEEEEQKTELAAVWIQGAQQAIQAAGGFRNYKGSLTTPPCTEGVNWFVAKEPIPLSVPQFRALYETMPFNARFTMPGPLVKSG
ncbi:alpha carbonic anhydrase [Hyaloraphidium curvatum]|nr:alpha carbonic anhydrase [Hyaloraphidium curvatum]